jgi:hypothetical protein
MKKNAYRFPKPTVSLDDFKSQLERFGRAIVGALDGSRKAYAELKSAREAVTHSLDQLGHYVEGVGKKDVEMFLSSGFELAGGGGTSSDVCPIPRMLWVRQGSKSGELLVAWTLLYRKARHYELRRGPQGPNAERPESWTIDKHIQGRRPARIEGLSPATVYVFQVRAYANNGEYSDWSSRHSHVHLRTRNTFPSLRISAAKLGGNIRPTPERNRHPQTAPHL